MKGIKRIIATLLSLMFIVSLVAACDSDTGGSAPAEGGELENLEGKRVAAFVLIEDQFQRMLQISMTKTFEEYGAIVIPAHSGGQLDREVETVNNLVGGGIDGIAIFPVSQIGSVAALENASNNGAMVFAVNMDLETDWQVGYAEMDQYGIGVGVGAFAREYVQEHFPDSKPKVAIMQFTALLPEMSAQRTNGFLSQVEDLVEIVTDVDAWDSDVSVIVAAEVMNAHPDLDIFFVMNEGGTVGTVMAIRNAGLSIPVFGIDMSAQLADMLLSDDGILQAVCGQDPIALGAAAAYNLSMAMMGKSFQSAVQLPGLPFTRNNPDEIREYIIMLNEFMGD